MDTNVEDRSTRYHRTTRSISRYHNTNKKIIQSKIEIPIKSKIAILDILSKMHDGNMYNKINDFVVEAITSYLASNNKNLKITKTGNVGDLSTIPSKTTLSKLIAVAIGPIGLQQQKSRYPNFSLTGIVNIVKAVFHTAFYINEEKTIKRYCSYVVALADYHSENIDAPYNVQTLVETLTRIYKSSKDSERKAFWRMSFETKNMVQEATENVLTTNMHIRLTEELIKGLDDLILKKYGIKRRGVWSKEICIALDDKIREINYLEQKPILITSPQNGRRQFRIMKDLEQNASYPKFTIAQIQDIVKGSISAMDQRTIDGFSRVIASHSEMIPQEIGIPAYDVSSYCKELKKQIHEQNLLM